MAVQLKNKHFNTIETLQRLLRYREVMFRVIEHIDIHNEGAIPETQFYSYIVEMQHSASKDQANEVAMVFDVENLIQARIINDRRTIDGTTKILFNNNVIEIFRLCKVSLYRPLTKVSLNSAMSPLWSLTKQSKNNTLHHVPGSDDYQEWVSDLIYRVSDLLGKIRTNIAKLENVGQEFEQRARADSDSGSLLEVKRESYQLASKLYRREIEPLKTFLDKHARYEEGDGIIITLDYFYTLFVNVKDEERAELMNSYLVQYLELFTPIKRVADQVSVYLQTTQQTLNEYSAIERAYSVVLQAYEKTLSGDMRNKFIDISNLRPLYDDKTQIPSLPRIKPFRFDKEPAFLDVIFNTLAERVQSFSPEQSDEILLAETITKKAAKQLLHSKKLARWADGFEWPYHVDFMSAAHSVLSEDFENYKLADLFEVQSRLIHSPKYDIKLMNDYQIIKDSKYELQYRVRHIVNLNEQEEMV